MAIPVSDLRGNRHSSAPENAPAPPFIIRLEKLQATPASLARIGERVREINRRLGELGMPFRLRLL